MTLKERTAWLQKESTVLATLVHGDEQPDLVELRAALTKLASEVHFALVEVRQRLVDLHQSAAAE